MGGTSCLTRKPQPLGAGAPRLPFAASYQFIGQNERFQGALKLGRLSTGFPSFSLQCSPVSRWAEPGEALAAPLLPCNSTHQPGSPGHPAHSSPILGSHGSVFWKHCIWQLPKWNTARLLLRKNVVFKDFPRNSRRKEFGRVTYGVHETPACCPSPPQGLPCVPLLNILAPPSPKIC